MRLSLRQYVWKPWRTTHMPHAIIRGGNGRRQEVDFTNAEICIEVYSSDGTVEIVVEAVNDLAPRRRGPRRVRNRSHPPPPPRCISGKNVCEPSSFSFSLRVNRPRSVRLAVRAHTGVEGLPGFAVRELRCNDP